MQNQQWSERIRWPWWLMLMVVGLDFSIIIAIWASLGNTAALVATLMTLIFTIYLFAISTLNISVDSGYLRVGRANIEKQYVGKIEVLTREEFDYLCRAGINPSAFHALRFWVKRGVKIEISDPRDPTPYWLVSSRRPEQFAAELER